MWRCGPTRAMSSSFLRFLDHTQRRTTVGRTPLGEWSARRRDLYLTTHNTHNRQTSMPRVGFFLLYLVLHCHYITIIRFLLVRLSSVTVRHIYFGLSKYTVLTVVIFMIGNLFNFGQWLSGSCQRDFGPACDSTVSIEFGVGSPWNLVGSRLYVAGFWKWRCLLSSTIWRCSFQWAIY